MMKTLTLLFAAAASLSVVQAEAPFTNVDQTLQPKFKCDLAIERIAAPFNQLNLVHRLVFDGESYRSRIFVPELVSYVTEPVSDAFTWKDLSGAYHSLSFKSGARKGAWKASREGDRVIIASIDGAKIFEYVGGNLRKTSVDNVVYILTKRGNQLLVDREAENGSPAIIIEYGPAGRIERMTLPTGTFEFKYENGQLISCQELGLERPLLSAAYTPAGLLQNLSINGSASLKYRWADVRRVEYFNPVRPLPPFVTWDGHNDYVCTLKSRNLLISFRTEDGRVGKTSVSLARAGATRAP